MTYKLRIEHADGTTDTLEILSADSLGDSDLPSLQGLSTRRKIAREPDEVDSAECRVYCDAWAEVKDSIDEFDDKFFIEKNGTDIFGSRIRDDKTDGTTVSVLLDGPKRDAIGAQPSGGNDVYSPQSDDSLITNELLPRANTLSAGTITQQAASIGFSESQASPGKSITKLAEATGAETLYQPDFTLDYVSSLGSDRTGTTLSPSNGNLIGEPSIQRKETESITHIRVLGSQEGTAQVTAEATIDGTTTREVWQKYSDKDILEQSRANELAQTLADEYSNNPEFIDVRVPIAASVNPVLGDTFNVSLPNNDINEDLRVIELERIVDQAGERFRAVLSNRKLTRKLSGARQRRSVNEFREGNAGQYYALADGEGWDKIQSGEPYEMTFYRPQNTIGEYRAKLRVKSREYRLPSSDPGHTHSVTVPDHNHSVSIPDHNHLVGINVTSADNSELSNVVSSGSLTEGTFSLNDSWSQIADIGPTSSANSSWAIFYVGVRFNPDSTTADTMTVKARLQDSKGDYYPDSTGQFVWVQTGKQSSFTFAFVIGRDVAAESIDLEMETNISSGGSAEITHAHQAIGAHNHLVNSRETTSDGGGTTETTTDGGGTTETTSSESALQPGVNSQSGKTVSGVDIDIDGMTVASGLSHPIDTTIDVSNEFGDGANEITAISSSLGELRLKVEYEGLKNANS